MDPIDNQTQKPIDQLAEKITPAEPDNKNLKASEKKPLNKRLILIIVGVVSVILLVGIVIFMLLSQSSKNNETEELIEQNKRLQSFPPTSEIEPESTEMIDARKKVLEYAKKNNITISEEEISTKKDQLKSTNGDKSVQDILNTYGWSQDDWTEVVRWQLLREKILRFAQPSRQGETVSIRWDMFAPELTQEYADQQSPIAIQYLNKIKQDLEEKRISKFYDVYTAFDVREEPIFEGKEDQFGLQYSGWDPEKNAYKEYLVVPDSSVFNDIYSQKIPSVSEPFCNIGGCQIYNVVSGSNGDGEASEVIDILTKQELYF